MRRILLATMIAIAACADPSSAGVPTTTPAPSVTTSTPTGTSIETGSGLPLEVFAPETTGRYPVVVTIHGGAWVTGDPAQMAPLASNLADRGMVVFNATYQTMETGGRFPDMVQDVACDIVAARRAAPAFTETPDRVVVVAHSAGAQMASLVALAPDAFPCHDGAVARIDGFVGLAGPYDVSRVQILTTWFGATIDEDPELWASGNPLVLAGAGSDLPFLLVHGTDDQVVPLSFSTDLADALSAAGASVELVTLEGADHSDVRDPLLVGDLIEGFVTGR